MINYIKILEGRGLLPIYLFSPLFSTLNQFFGNIFIHKVIHIWG